MDLRTFYAKAARCSNLMELERLFIDERRYVYCPDYKVMTAWRKNYERILDGRDESDTGEVLEELET